MVKLVETSFLWLVQEKYYVKLRNKYFLNIKILSENQ